MPPWAGEIAKQAIGSALGTLIAALVLFIGGAAFGVISGVDAGAIAGASAFLLLSILVLFRALQQLQPLDATRRALGRQRRRRK